ncbi:MAG: hypothetical protein V3U19_07760 [Thermodesulfobacteriota bacterium]
MRSFSDLFGDIDVVPPSDIFILFALVSLALFPLIFYTNRSVADSGFIFAFFCLSVGVVLKMAQFRGGFSSFKSPVFFRYIKLLIYVALSLVFLYLGFRWLGVFGVVFFSSGIIGIMLLCSGMKKKPVFSVDEGGFSFGKEDMYYTGALLFVTLFSIRKLLTTEPIVYYDWFGFGMDALDGFRLWGTQLSNIREFFATPLILLLGNELAGNIFLLVWIPLASITFYCLAVRLLGDRTAGFVASFVYVFNPAVLDRFLSAHVGMLIGYTAMPLVLLLFVLSLENKNPWGSIVFSLLAGMFLAFSGLIQSHFFYLHALLLGFYLIFYLMTNSPFEDLKKGISAFVLVLFTAVLLSSVWILPAVRRAGFGYYSSSATMSYVESLSSQTQLYNIFRLIGQSGGPFMDGVGYTGLSIWPLMGFVAVLLGFSALLLHKEGREGMVLIFSMIALMGIILSTGTLYIGGFYRWLFLNFPFFFAFREPSKFLVLAGFGLSMLVGITVEAVLSLRRPNVRLMSFLVPLFLSLVLLSQGIFAWPMFAGDNLLYSQHPRYTLSEEYRELGAWVDSQEGVYKVIVLPYTGFIIRTWHFVSKKPLLYISTSSLSPLNSDAYQSSIFMFEILERGDLEGFAVLAGLEGIKYIVVDRDLDLRLIKETPDDYNFIPPFNRFNLSGSSLVQFLQASSEFEKMREFGPYVLFENRRFIKRTGRENPVFAVGDRNLIFELDQRLDFDFSENDLVFASQLKHGELDKLVKTENVIISDSDENALLFSLLDGEYKIDVYDYAFPAGLGDDPRNIIYERWIRSDIFEFLEGGVFGRGAIPHGRGYAITRGNAILRMPFYSLNRGHHQIWVRMLHAPDRGDLKVFFDNEKVGEVSPLYTDYKGFIWVKMGEVDLTKGAHNVEILNSHGENVIDQIAFLPL